jgi:hypothetical protein
MTENRTTHISKFGKSFELFQSVGDSSVSSGSTGSARGLSPTRSDDSRSVSPLPHFQSKPKTTTSTISNNSSSGTVSIAKKSTSMSNMFSPSSRKTSLPEGIQPPPRTKKRAAPPPPSLVKSQTESAIVSKVNESSIIPQPDKPLVCSRPTPKKKEAPRVPPNVKPLDSSLPSTRPTNNHSRHSSGSSGYHESSVLSEQNEPYRVER